MKKKNLVIDNQMLAAQLVRSWRDNFIKESNGISPLLIVGGKCLMATDIFTNIAVAIDNIPRPKSIMVKL